MEITSDFDPILVQKSIRDNSNEIQAFLKDLADWQNEQESMDVDESKIATPKNDKVNELKLDQSCEPTPKRRITDYSSWEKFNVDSECDKVDKMPSSNEKQKQEALYLKEKGNVLVRNGKWKEASECYSRAIRNYSKDPTFYANRALCHLKLKNFKQVEDDCDQALNFDPNYIKALQRRAYARVALKKYEDAEVDFRKALKLDPNNKIMKTEIEKLQPFLKTTVSRMSTESQAKKRPFLWPTTHNNIEVIEPIEKQGHSRSKKPMQRVPVTPLKDDNCSVSKPITIFNEVLIKPTAVDIDILDPPTTSYQFMIDWKSLKETTSFEKCKYLRKIDAKLFPKLFQGCFNEFFSDILAALAENCHILNFNPFPYLKEMPKVDRFRLNLMFLTQKDQKNVVSLFDECQHYENIEDIDRLRKQYEL